jgi:hypothetical protein
VPFGWHVIRRSLGHSAALNASSGAPREIFLAVKRDPGIAPIAELRVILPELGESAPSDEWDLIATTLGGSSANLHAGAPPHASGGAAQPLFLCARRLQAESVDNATFALMDIRIMWPAKDSLPAGFSKLAKTAVGMEPDLNAGCSASGVHKVLLCTKSALPLPPPAPHDVNGTYISDVLGTVNLYCVAELAGTAMCGVLGATRHLAQPAAATAWSSGGDDPGEFAMLPRSTHAGVEAIAVDCSEGGAGALAAHDCFAWTGAEALAKALPKPKGGGVAGGATSSATRVLGRFRNGRSGAWNLCEWTMDTAFTQARGSWVKGGKRAKEWPLVRDDYLKLCWKRDFNTMYVAQTQRFTDRCAANTVGSMLASELSPSVVVGFTCEACATEGEMIEHPAIETAPQILTVLLNRIDFDRASQRPVRFRVAPHAL